MGYSCAQLVLTCTAGTTHATLALTWFLHAVGSRMHSGHNTRHSRAQLVLVISHAQRVHHTPLPRSLGSRDRACTAGTTHATLALSWFLHAVGSRMHSGHNTRHSRDQLVLVISHAQRVHHTPLPRSLGSRDLACTAGTTHATLALSWVS